MIDIVLGQLANENSQRDAIHIAIAPVVAATNLKPGAHVGLDNNGEATGTTDFPIGIVDPFLSHKVLRGETFYLLLYQNTVTGMRHHWSHPSFEDNKIVESSFEYTKEESEKWLRAFINDSECPTYDEVLAAATGGELSIMSPEYYDTAYENDGEYLHFSGRDAHGNIPPEFWDHIENVTGIKIPKNKRASYWSCSC